MPIIQVLLLFFSLHLTLNSLSLASTIINSGPLEQDISSDFLMKSETYQKNQKSSLRFGYFNGEKWARVTLANQTSEPLKKIIYFDTLTGKINLYDQGVLLATSGSSLPFLKREIGSIFASFKIELPPKSEKTLNFQIISRHNFNSKVFIGDSENLKKREIEKLSFLDFYAGGIVCLILYNLFIFSFLKDKNYLYYCFFSLSFLLVILDIHGLLDKLFATSAFSFSHHLICFSAMALMSAVLFTYHFLEIPTHLPKLKTPFKIYFALSLVVFLIGLTPLEDKAPVVFGSLIDLLIITANLIFIICSVLLLKISSPARFYFFSWVVVALSLLSWFGMTFGLFPNNFFTQHSLLYANLGQMLVLSLALAYRIHKLTEEKLAAEEKALQKEKYQRLVRVLSHDIANSLTIVNSYSKKLIKPKNLEPNLQRIVEKIYFAAENIKSILVNVREEELLDVRKKQIELYPIKVLESISAAAVVFEEHLKHKKLELIIDVPEGVMIMANETCFLNNIVNNIISNSIKFSFENSKIEIGAVTTPEQIALSFRDYGCGIDPKKINDIFFTSKIHSTLGTKSEVGHGFGTILMREYVELFKGRLKVESALKKPDESTLSGTCVTLVFPLVQ